MSDLKPCPFCKSDDLSVHFDDGFSYYVWCGNCGSQTDNNHLTKKEAIKAWNTRPTEDALYNQMAELYYEMNAMRAALFEIANFGKGQPFKFRTKAEYIDNFRLIQKMAKDVLNKYAPDTGKMEEK